MGTAIYREKKNVKIHKMTCCYLIVVFRIHASVFNSHLAEYMGSMANEVIS
jgi:hypothetical protein